MSARARRYLNKRARELDMHADAFSAEVVAIFMENYHQHRQEREQCDKMDKSIKQLHAILKKLDR